MRNASPTGTSADCTTTPCDIQTALSGAQTGDEVIVEPGDYGAVGPLSSGMENSNDIYVHGELGQPRPRIYITSAYGLHLVGPNSIVRHLELHAVAGAAHPVGLDFTGDVAEDLIVEAPAVGGSGACIIGHGALLRNSVCSSDATSAPAIRVVENDGTNNVALRNVTGVALGTAAGLYVAGATGNNATVTVVNSILDGASNGITTTTTGSGSVTVTPTYSNIVGHPPVDSSLGGTVTTSPTNVTAPARFVDRAGGDFHQAATSPTIDKGVTFSPAIGGTADYDGQPRAGDGHVDIGADELLPPTATTRQASSITNTGAAVAGVANDRNAGGARVLAEYGTTKAYGKRSPTKPIPASNDDQPATLSLTKLTPGTTYHYRVLIEGPAGNGRGADRTFKTTGTAPFTGLVLAKRQKVTVHDGLAKVKATCPPTAKVRCKGTLSLTKGKKPKQLGKAPFDVPKGKAKIQVQLNDAALALLDKGRVKAKAVAKTRDGSGGTARKTSGKVTLKAAAAAAAAR